LRKWWVENKKSSFFLGDLFFWIVWQMMERDKMEGNGIGEFYGFIFFFESWFEKLDKSYKI